MPTWPTGSTRRAQAPPHQPAAAHLRDHRVGGDGRRVERDPDGRAARPLGVNISIDDFGTGYSSLAYLRKLRAGELKIDSSFVLDLETSADARAVVDAVVKLAQALGLKVVAEGVETEAQHEILRSLGCHELQGFLFARPMSAEGALGRGRWTTTAARALEFRDSLYRRHGRPARCTSRECAVRPCGRRDRPRFLQSRP